MHKKVYFGRKRRKGMNHYTGYELIWLFFIYSFAGWILESIVASTKQRKYVNRGLINGPFCVMYGIAAVLMTFGLQELTGVWLFLFATLYVTVVEWVGGHLIERIYHERWWDYSNIKWNLDGYICLPISVFNGVLGYIGIRWGNELFLYLLGLFPDILIHIILLILLVILVADVLASYLLLTGKTRRKEQWEFVDDQLSGVSQKLGGWIYRKMDARIHKAYPKSKKVEVQPKDKTVFAKDCDFYKVVLLFFIGAFLGDITETIFCRITAGVWMSRSSVVWGPFSIVWGLAIALVTAMLYRYKDRKESFLFWIGTFLGGAYEYLCSVFTEMVFGKVFWDYSKMPFNLGGRINLLYCFFWGIAAVVWFKKIYPVISKWIEKIPVKFGKVMTWFLIVFMCANVVVSCMALIRYDQRGREVEADKSWKEWVDEHYDDGVMERIYPNAKDAAKE